MNEPDADEPGGLDEPDRPTAPDADAGADGAGLRFGAAMDELTALVAELESDSLDVDELTDRVARAADLVQWCRDRIDAARFSVEEVLVRLDPDANGPSGAPDTDDDDTPGS